jgi:hypothetical protein
MNWLSIAALAVGILSALAYGLRRRWIDALLAVVAGVALAAAVGSFALPGDMGRTLALSASTPPGSLDGVRTLKLDGDGLRAAQWDDLPARPLAWTVPATPTIRLDFPRTIALGRVFTLTVSRPGKDRAGCSCWRKMARCWPKRRTRETATACCPCSGCRRWPSAWC